MQIEGIHIDLKTLEGVAMISIEYLKMYASMWKQEGKKISKEKVITEHEDKKTYLNGKELSDFFRVDYQTICRWRKKEHPKFEAVFSEHPTRIEMSLFEAKKLRRQILGI